MAISKIIGSGLGNLSATGTTFGSTSFNVIKIQTDSDDNGNNDDGILQFTNGSGNTVKGELRFDESTSAFEIGFGDNQGHVTLNAGGVVINEDSRDLDFRVESNGNVNMLFVDGGSDHLNIGTANDLGSPFNVLTEMSVGADGNNRGIINFSSNILSFGTVQGGSATFSSLKVSSGGVTVANGLTLTDGNLIVANGHGISFAATGDGGVSTPNELLDDYEEGTWTPIFDNVTAPNYTTQLGKYTKIGRFVSLICAIQPNNIDTNDGSGIIVTGFPFAGDAATESVNFTLGRFTSFLGDNADNVENMRFTGSGVMFMNGSNSNITYNAGVANALLQFSVTYQTT